MVELPVKPGGGLQSVLRLEVGKQANGDAIENPSWGQGPVDWVRQSLRNS